MPAYIESIYYIAKCPTHQKLFLIQHNLAVLLQDTVLITCHSVSSNPCVLHTKDVMARSHNVAVSALRVRHKRTISA